MADGSIMIETKLSTDKFDKQITDLEKKIKDEEKKSELKLKAKLQSEDELEKHKQKIVEIEQEYEKTSQQVEHLQNIMSKQSQGVSLTPQDFTDLQNYAEINKQNEKLGATLDKAYEKQTKLNNKVEQTSLAYKQIQDNVQGYKTKIESVKLQKQQAQVEQIKNGFNKMNTSVSSSIKHIGRLALGIFSVASAYRLMSAASSTLGQYDEQYATNLEYIRYLIAQAIAPALKYVVNLASTLLSYLNYIAQAWFGITLFSKNSAKNFMNAKNSTGGISKNTGKIKKDLQTTSFDEMNVLSDTSTSGGTSGGSGGGAIAPSIDPSMLQGEVPEWLKWIAENKDLVIGALTGIAIAIGLIKLSDLIGGLKNLGILLEPIKTFLTEHGKTLAGILAIIGGIAMIIDGVIKYLKDPSWENFIEIMAGIALVVGGVMLLFGGIPALITAIILVLGALGLAIYKHWDEVKAVLSKVGQWIYDNIITPVMKFFKALFDTILSIIKTAISIISGIFTTLIEILKNPFVVLWETVKGLFESIKLVFTGILNIIKGIFTGDIKQVFEGAKQIFKGFANAIWTILKAPINFLIGGINALIQGINKIKFDVPDWVPGIGGKQLGFSIPQIPRLAKGTILNAPGRGVPVSGGTALAGEAGREAYLPLSDTQLLEELGSTIGKYITINANITNSMNGRVISRQLQQIKNDREFAYNG